MKNMFLQWLHDSSLRSIPKIRKNNDFKPFVFTLLQCFWILDHYDHQECMCFLAKMDECLTAPQLLICLIFWFHKKTKY